jgi:hypothetical protein
MAHAEDVVADCRSARLISFAHKCRSSFVASVAVNPYSVRFLLLEASDRPGGAML